MFGNSASLPLIYNGDPLKVKFQKRISDRENLSFDDEFRDGLISAMEALVCLDKMLELKETTIQKLRKIFNKKTEFFKKNKNSDNNSKNSNKSEDNKPYHPRGNNKGRNSVDKFKGARTVWLELLKVPQAECCFIRMIIKGGYFHLLLYYV